MVSISSNNNDYFDRKKAFRLKTAASLFGAAGCLLLVGSASAADLEDALVQKTVQVAPNLEPVIPHPDQEKEALIN